MPDFFYFFLTFKLICRTKQKTDGRTGETPYVAYWHDCIINGEQKHLSHTSVRMHLKPLSDVG